MLALVGGICAALLIQKYEQVPIKHAQSAALLAVAVLWVFVDLFPSTFLTGVLANILMLWSGAMTILRRFFSPHVLFTRQLWSEVWDMVTVRPS
jgi:membrane-bound ClpP family serine protease